MRASTSAITNQTRGAERLLSRSWGTVSGTDSRLNPRWRRAIGRRVVFEGTVRRDRLLRGFGPDGRHRVRSGHFRQAGPRVLGGEKVGLPIGTSSHGPCAAGAWKATQGCRGWSVAGGAAEPFGGRAHRRSRAVLRLEAGGWRLEAIGWMGRGLGGILLRYSPTSGECMGARRDFCPRERESISSRGIGRQRRR